MIREVPEVLCIIMTLGSMITSSFQCSFPVSKDGKRASMSQERLNDLTNSSVERHLL